MSPDRTSESRAAAPTRGRKSFRCPHSLARWLPGHRAVLGPQSDEAFQQAVVAARLVVDDGVQVQQDCPARLGHVLEGPIAEVVPAGNDETTGLGVGQRVGRGVVGEARRLGRQGHHVVHAGRVRRVVVHGEPRCSHRPGRS